jgi:hypothetical protein
LQGFFEFEAAAAYVFEIGAEEAEFGVDGDLGAGLVDALFGDEDAAGEDEGLCTLAGDGVAVVDEKFVETYLWLLGRFVHCGPGVRVHGFRMHGGYLPRRFWGRVANVC